MAITDKNTLKSWFRKGLKPLETNFADWIDSYWHKAEQIPTSSIQGLENTLNQKAETAEVHNLNQTVSNLQEDIKNLQTSDTCNNIVTFSETANRTPITSGETHTSLFGKISKWFSSLGNLAFKDSLPSLSVRYQQGETMDYDGSSPQTIHLPKIEEKIRMIGIDPNTYLEVEEHSNFLFQSELLGIPFEANTLCLQKIHYENGGWTVESEINAEHPSGTVQIDQISKNEQAYYRWCIRYVNPITQTQTTAYSAPAFLHVANTNTKELLPLDPTSYAEGYPLRNSANNTATAEITFKMYGFTPQVSATIFEKINEEWQTSTTTTRISSPFLHCDVNALGSYRLVITDGDFQTDKEFSVKPYEKETCAYIHIDYHKYMSDNEAEAEQATQQIINDFKKISPSIRPLYLCFYSNAVGQYLIPISSINTYRLIKITATANDQRFIDEFGGNSITLSWSPSSDNINVDIDKTNQSVILLYENNDGIIGGGDVDMSLYPQKMYWLNFHKQLTKGEQPIIYLKTRDSDSYFPAYYQLTPTPENPNKFKGFIAVSYPKTIDGIDYLIVNKKEFNGDQYDNYFTGLGSTYLPGDTQPIMKKYPLGDSVRVSRIQVVDTLPTENLQEGDIIILKQS